MVKIITLICGSGTFILLKFSFYNFTLVAINRIKLSSTTVTYGDVMRALSFVFITAQIDTKNTEKNKKISLENTENESGTATF